MSNLSNQRTALYEVHQTLGAKIIPFGGFDMPVNYPKGILAEHRAVREAVGMFDVSHMGEIEVHGNDALAFVQYVTTNDVSALKHGQAQYSVLCYDDGGIVDDLLVYCMNDGDETWYMLVVNAANIEKDWSWLQSHAAAFDVQLSNVSNETNLLAVQGPHSLKTLKKLTSVALEEIAYYHCTLGTLAGVDMVLSRTGYTGELGFELYFKGGNNVAIPVWQAIIEAGAEFGLEPIGLGARDTLRLEKGYCLYGNDIDQTTNPLEAGLGWVAKLRKADFVGKTALINAKEAGVRRKLVGLRLQQENIIPRQHYAIHADSKQIGIVTSGGISPVLGKGIALGYVETAYTQPGTVVQIAVRGKEYAADVVKVPFV